MKRVIIIGDGMSDYPLGKLRGKTPLQVARKPAIDRLAKEGATGLFVTIEEDMPPGSEVANLSVLGYDPRSCYRGRGVLEAASMGVELRKEQLAFRANLICVEEGKIRSHSAGHIGNDESHALIRELDDALGTAARLYPGVSYRHLLVLDRGSTDVECAPPHDHPGEPFEENLVKAKSEEGQETAEFLNRLIRDSNAFLESHPINEQRAAEGKQKANFLWPWSGGRKPKMQTLQQRFGITGAVISAVDLIKGLGRYAGMDVIEVPGATGFSDTNYEGKAIACLEALDDHDLVYLHVEATDEAAHDGDLELKIRCIEYLDQRIVAPVVAGIEKKKIEAVVAVLPDHPTPVEQRIHVKDPVPVAIRGKGIRADSVQTFDEESVKKGALGLLRGDAFIRRLLAKP